MDDDWGYPYFRKPHDVPRKHLGLLVELQGKTGMFTCKNKESLGKATVTEETLESSEEKTSKKWRFDMI